jgi:hypothetical protein
MRKILIVVAALGLGAAHAEEPSKTPFDPEVAEVAHRATEIFSLHRRLLAEHVLWRGTMPPGREERWVRRVRDVYVLGAVDMMREWQKIDPVHALPVCVPRNARAGDLIIAIQEHIEATAPWRRQQFDAATAVIAALAAKWPCERR